MSTDAIENSDARNRDSEKEITDAEMTKAGELYEDVHDIFRLAQRSAILIVKHKLGISHLGAARIVEAWWFGCRNRF
jgi:hypothetical protein